MSRDACPVFPFSSLSLLPFVSPFNGAGNGSARVAACAQQLLEHSLLTELQGVVARTLQGVDMFSQQQLAGILGHTHTLPASPSDAALAKAPVRVFSLSSSWVLSCLTLLPSICFVSLGFGWSVSSCLLAC